MSNVDPALFLSPRYTLDELRSLLQQPCEPSGDAFMEQFRCSLAADPELLELASHARIDSVMPSFLLSAVYYLNSLYPNPEVADFFDPSRTTQDYQQKYECFRSHCLQHREELINLLASRHVQTNNLHRCAVLFPALCIIQQFFPDRPCTLFDLGTSAGLHLLCDLYAYAYPELGGRVFASKFKSEVDLELEFSWRGNKPRDPATFFRVPTITERIGIDLAPIDLSIPEQRQWLEAFNPIDDAVLEAFLALRQLAPFRFVTGDVLKMLEPLANTVVRENLLIVVDSFMTVQFNAEAKAAFCAKLDLIGASRDLAVIALENELTSTAPVELWLQIHRNGSCTKQRLARCQYPLDVGEWLEWLGPVD